MKVVAGQTIVNETANVLTCDLDMTGDKTTHEFPDPRRDK